MLSCWRKTAFGLSVFLAASLAFAFAQGSSAEENIDTKASATATGAGNSTMTGIPLDTPWKRSEYAYAKQNVVHPSWGLSHAERDYRNAVELAKKEKLAVDTDVLFTAAYLHDLGGIGTFQKPKVDHGVRSAELAEPLLKEWGFPMEKWPKVKATIIGHVYYGPAPTVDEAKVFHDADCLDFLGAMGVARMFAAAGDLSKVAGLSKPKKTIAEFASDIPAKLVTQSAKFEAKNRVQEMNSFLEEFDRYTFNGQAL